LLRSLAFRFLQSEFAEAGMIVWPGAERPSEFAVHLGYGKIIDAGDASTHQAIPVELPILVPIRAEPITAVVMPFIGEAHRNAIARESPDFFDEPIVQFARPLASEKRHDFLPAGKELGAISPNAVLRIGQRDALTVAGIPGIFGPPSLVCSGLGGEWGQRRPLFAHGFQSLPFSRVCGCPIAF